MMQIRFFDVDQTLIDSDARFHAACTKGFFNVDFYRANQTDEMLANDKVLPLLTVAQGSGLLKRSYILTARDMLPADFRQFERLGLECLHIYHRGNAPDYIAAIQNNGEYKKAYIEHLRLIRFNNVKSDNNGNWACIYDDDKGVLNMAKSIGVIAYDAVKINNLLKAA